MPRKSLASILASRRAESGGDQSVRFLDLRIDVYAEDREGNRTNRLLGSVGGSWDRRLRMYSPSARARRVAVSVHPGQIDAVIFFFDWLRDHARGVRRPADSTIYSMLLAGGQRSGKTWSAVLMAICYAVAIPASISWVVSPSDKDFEEVEDLLRTILPAAWYQNLGAPWYRYKFANGSKIVLRSAHLPEKLKKGDCDLIVLNEAQQMAERAFVIARTRIAAASGLVICAANPPTKPAGQWVGDFATEAQAGTRQAKYFHLDPMDNPHIDLGPLRALEKEIDEHQFNVEIRGMFLANQNAVLYNWNRTENERPTPVTGEITAEFLKAAEGREYDRAIVVDVQRLPHMASAEFRWYTNPATAGQPHAVRMQWALMWATSELFLKGADEEELAQQWLLAGFDPDRTLIVCDASGEWQFSHRDPLKVAELKEKVSGRGSFDVFRKMGFRYVVKPDRASEKNPDIIERCRAATSRIATKIPGPYGQRFLFSDPTCRELNKAIRNWATRRGAPDRTSEFAHGGDVVTYAAQRFYARRFSATGLPEVKVLQRHDPHNSMKGW